MKNDFEVRGEVTAILINSKRYGSVETLISTNDLEKAKEFKNTWNVYFNKSTKSLYAVGYKKINDKDTVVSLHRWITSAPKGLEVDHINHDTLDNRRENLRIVTTAQNQQNRKGIPSNNTSGIKNVHWHKAAKKWEVQVKVNRKKLTIGYYKDIKQAEIAARNAREKYFPFSI